MPALSGTWALVLYVCRWERKVRRWPGLRPYSHPPHLHSHHGDWGVRNQRGPHSLDQAHCPLKPPRATGLPICLLPAVIPCTLAALGQDPSSPKYGEVSGGGVGLRWGQQRPLSGPGAAGASEGLGRRGVLEKGEGGAFLKEWGS